MRRAIAVLGALLVGLGSLALAPAAAGQPLRLTVGTLGPIGSLDPRTGTSQIAHEVWNLQYPALTTFQPKTLDPAPGLAQAWTPAPKGRGWVYTLRPGLQWSDGRPVTADDVANSVERARFGTAQVVGPRAVEITGPTAPGAPVNVTPAHVLSRVPDLNQDLHALGVADGPWHVTARTNDSVQLDATRPGGPALQRIVFRTYSDPDTLIRALDQGDVDVVSGLPTTDATRLESMSNVTVDHAPDGTQYVLNDTLPDLRVRQAISLAIDRTDLVAKVVDGIGTPGVVPVLARGKAWGLDDATTERLTASLDAQPGRARALLAAAGAPTRTLRLAAPADATSQRVAKYVEQALERVGLHVQIVKGETSDLGIVHETTSDEPPQPRPGRVGSATESYPARQARTRALTQQDAEQARLVGLFQPDTLQAFRSDNVAGFLRTPQIPSLVVFAPTTTQYLQLSKAPPPPGEQASTTTYVVGAIGVIVLCGAALAVAAWIRRRLVA